MQRSLLEGNYTLSGTEVNFSRLTTVYNCMELVKQILELLEKTQMMESMEICRTLSANFSASECMETLIHMQSAGRIESGLGGWTLTGDRSGDLL